MSHTADSLKFYLGCQVYTKEFGKAKLIALSCQTLQPSFLLLDTGGIPKVEHRHIYPILKTVEDMSDVEIAKIYHCSVDNIERETEDDPFSCDEIAYSGVRIWYRCSYEYEEYDTHNIYTDFSYSVDYGGVTPKKLVQLLGYGAGAIPDKSSPTGYVDLFGNPCVTPKQVEEGVEL